MPKLFNYRISHLFSSKIFNTSFAGGNGGANVVSTSWFTGQNSIRTQYLRVVPLANSLGLYGHPLRVELYGCKLSNGSALGTSALSHSLHTTLYICVNKRRITSVQCN